MYLVKKVREIIGLNPWSMHKLMKKRSIQAYLSLERSAERISLADYLALQRIYIEHTGGSVSDFTELVNLCETEKETDN